MPPIVHVSAAIMALLLGASVLATPKGTTWHRRLGAAYATSLLLANIGALTMTGDSGQFGAFQLLAVLSLATLLVGLGLMRRRARTEQVIATHAIIMGFSYVGLVAAGLSQLAAHAAPDHRATAVLATSAGTFTLGAVAIFTTVPRALHSLGSATSPPSKAATRRANERLNQAGPGSVA